MASPLLYLLLILFTTIPSTLYIYNYPRIHGCEWPNPDAPFRLLALADPQIEGDKKKRSWRGRIDLWGNDRYLRHIHRSCLQQILPEATHEVVLGDLFGSQWISDEEFVSRVHRYSDIIFRDRLQGQLYGVDRFMNITGNHDVGYGGELSFERLERWETYFGPSNHVHHLEIPDLPPLRIVLFNSLNLDSPSTVYELQEATHSFLSSLLPEDEELHHQIAQTVFLTHLPLYRGPGICSDPPHFEYWSLNITDQWGNITGYFRPLKHQNHLSRWASDWILESVFGDHEEGIILDGHDHEGCDVLHVRLSDVEREYGFAMNDLFEHDELRKRDDGGDNGGDEYVQEGVEVPREEKFNYQHPPQEEENQHEPHPLEISDSEAHLRNNISLGIWKAEKFDPRKSGIREITVRSMMGDFQGNVGLLTGTVNNQTHLWEFQYSSCSFLTQHYWWIVHIWDCICGLWILGYITRPLWWRHWQRHGRPVVEKGLETCSVWIQNALEHWEVVKKSRRRQDTEQGGRKKL